MITRSADWAAEHGATTLALAVTEALGQLDPETRELLLLCTVEGTPYSEVAASYGIAVGTVKSRVHRARARLVDLLGDVLDDADEGGRVEGRPSVHRPAGAPRGSVDGRGPPVP